MNAEFGERVQRMPGYMQRLMASQVLSQSDLSSVPKWGIYVCHEDGEAIYVGRSNNMRARLRMHCRPSGGHESATFAFPLARRDPDSPRCEGMTRAEMQRYEPFRVIYDECKRRVAGMQIRVVQIDDQIDQTLFEVYAALELGTKCNDWRTH